MRPKSSIVFLGSFCFKFFYIVFPSFLWVPIHFDLSIMFLSVYLHIKVLVVALVTTLNIHNSSRSTVVQMISQFEGSTETLINLNFYALSHL